MNNTVNYPGKFSVLPKNLGKMTMFQKLMGMLAVLVWISGANAATLQDIDFASLSGDRVEMKLTFDEAPPEPRSYTIDQPARITLDLMGVNSGLEKKIHQLGLGNARSVAVLEAGNRTRVVVNLTDLVNYTTSVEGNALYIRLGEGGDGFNQQTAVADAGDNSTPAPVAQPVNPGLKSITNVDFRRGEQGEGRVEITLSQPDVELDIAQEGSNVRINFANANLPEALSRRLDVVDFATPVTIVDSLPEGKGTTVFIETEGTYDYLAYQTDNVLVVDFRPVTDDEAERRRKDKFPYDGEKLSLNFQDIEVRSVLQLIADFTNLNLVASDTVSGRITLRLQNVPWDQALDLILKTKGLDKRQIGNVLMVAPADEIANRERLELENSRQVAELAPLRTEFVQINYAKAEEIATLLSAEQGLLSSRGSVSVDVRTNTLLIQDTAAKLDGIRSALTYLDKPVRQVVIEARIVIAEDTYDKQLGIRWGAAYTRTKGDSSYGIDGGTGALVGPTGGITPLNVDLGVGPSTTSSFVLGFVNNDGLLNLELSALESDGQIENVSQPKLITADGQTAYIESGTEIPYEESSSSGATTIEFKEAVLRLEVTPQITPDGSIIMDLTVNNDSVSATTITTASGNSIPAIDTNEIQTQVLVENGETIVLGGVFNIETDNSIDKTPFLGDLPYIGRLFKRTQSEENKSELLIFITPKIISDKLSVR